MIDLGIVERNTELYDAALGLYAALKNMPCACQHNVPYAGGQVEQRVTVQCGRCKAIETWERLTQ
jgi:hypothetical protein